MSFTKWINKIKSAKKTSIIFGTVRIIHYTFPDYNEMVEEYSMETGVVLRRAWKFNNELTLGPGNWIIELGDILPRNLNDTNFLVKESLTEPILTKRITKINIEWRIRNLPYPIDVYSVLADSNEKVIIIKTNNKKYFKKIPIEELDRCELVPEQKNIKIQHQFNTLIITYKKPIIVNEMEKAVLCELKDVETENILD